MTANPKRLEAERYKWAFKFVDLGIFIAIGTAVQVNVFAVNNGLMDDKWLNNLGKEAAAVFYSTKRTRFQNFKIQQ